MIGIIYRIEYNENPEIRYIGSTLQELRYRWRDHKYAYNKWINNKHSKYSIYPYFKQYGIKNFKIILIKEYEVVDRTHLEAYEQLWINKLKCINSNNTIRINHLSNKQYRESNKEKIKEYYESNKENIKDYKKSYYESNKDKIKEYRELNKEKLLKTRKQYYELNKDKAKQYRESNKDKFKEYRESNKDKLVKYSKQYREKNKDKIKEQIAEKAKEQIKCDVCNCLITKYKKSRHEKSKKHLNAVGSKPN